MKKKFLLSGGPGSGGIYPGPFCSGDMLSGEMFGGMSLVGKCLDELLQKAQKPMQNA